MRDCTIQNSISIRTMRGRSLHNPDTSGFFHESLELLFLALPRCRCTAKRLTTPEGVADAHLTSVPLPFFEASFGVFASMRFVAVKIRFGIMATSLSQRQ